jgi:predicted DsbA family dithiol-disulfide isomerase
LGGRRLDAALERFGHRDDIEVVHRSFQLDPGAPPGVSRPVRAMLADAKGMSEAQILATVPRIEEMAASAGLRPYIVLGNRVGSTALASPGWLTGVLPGPRCQVPVGVMTP